VAQRLLTDGGLETDLIFNRGIDLPAFAAFPLVDTDGGRAVLRDYFHAYVDIAVRAEAPVLLDTPTWAANPDRAPAGYGPADLDRVNRASVALLEEIGRERADELVGWRVGGIVGPRGDAYENGAVVDPDEAAEYHRPQIAAFHAAGADRVTALTLTTIGEGIGVARAAADVDLPVAIGFTVETDGRLPDGSTLGEAVTAVDSVAAPWYFLVNCAHPTHIAKALDDGAWQQRIGGLRVNASTMSHAELDAAEELDGGDPARLAADQLPLLAAFPNVKVLGGCCGTDARHVAEMWAVSVTA